FASVELTAYCPMQACRPSGHRVCIRQGARAAVEHVAVPAGPRSPPVPPAHASWKRDRSGWCRRSRGRWVSPARDASLRAELSSSGNRRGLTDARVRPRAGCCGRCDTCLVQLTVLIVDDHAGFRQLARALLEAEGIEVVGEAADGESAITEAERLRPRLVLLDVRVPAIDGV